MNRNFNDINNQFMVIKYNKGKKQHKNVKE